MNQQPLNQPMNKTMNVCDLCEYSTPLLGNYKKHMMTQKHLWNYHNIKKSKEEESICHCGKQFKSRSGAWKHQKKCISKPSSSVSLSPPTLAKESVNAVLDTDAIMVIMKQNQEFKEFMVEHVKQIGNQLLQIAKTGINVTNNNTTNNVATTNSVATINTTNNVATTNHFNLTIFLNETCKEAINMQDFVKTLPITMSDLEETGKIGYTNGISRLFVNGLKILDVNKRPIHCSDYKREVLYIKDCDVWEKDGEEKNLIKQAIRMVESKNIKLIPQWKNEHPGVIKSDHKQNLQYLNIVCQSTGGDYSEEENNVNKIIKNILKEARITK